MGNKKWLGKHHTEETKKKISESKKGKKNPNLWNSISDENKKKILNAAIEKNRVEVEQFSLDGKLIKVWDSMVEAARSLGVWNTNIFKCCNGQAKTCGGFKWKYHKK
jgi:group I intron endonuclease